MENSWSLFCKSKTKPTKSYINADRTRVKKVATDILYAQAFEREFKHMKNLHMALNNCTYFPHYYEFGWSPSYQNPYIIMEYIQGETLTNYLKKSEKTYPEPRLLLSWNELRSITEQVYNALCILSEHGIFHYDLNPDNILVTKRGEDIQIHLIDFTSCYYISSQIEGFPCLACNNRMESAFKSTPSLALLNATMLFFIRLFFSEDSTYFSYLESVDHGESPTFFTYLFSNTFDLVFNISEELKIQYQHEAMSRDSLSPLKDWFNVIINSFP